MITTDDKARIHRLLNALTREPEQARTLFAADLAWHGQHPVNDGTGLDGWMTAQWMPLTTAMPDVERRDDILMAGVFREQPWICATGHYCGVFEAPLFGIPPTGHLAFLQYGEFYRLDADGRVAEIITIWDLVGLMRQAGFVVLAPTPGVEILTPGPRTHDGVRPGVINPDGGERTRLLVEAMIAGLMEYDGKSLQSMAQERFWSPDMLWYGPSGIGSNRRLKGFQDFHQRPFLTAFPDRIGGNHKSRIGDGAYCASTGWPSIQATHAGPYLGHPATGKRITMRVMDWWRREGDLLAENWVFIDLPHLFLQFGQDLFADMAGQARRR